MRSNGELLPPPPTWCRGPAQRPSLPLPSPAPSQGQLFSLTRNTELDNLCLGPLHPQIKTRTTPTLHPPPHMDQEYLFLLLVSIWMGPAPDSSHPYLSTQTSTSSSFASHPPGTLLKTCVESKLTGDSCGHCASNTGQHQAYLGASAGEFTCLGQPATKLCPHLVPSSHQGVSFLRP